jgi:adenylate kinase
MKIVLLGPPGAGKGTQAKQLAEQYQFEHLSSGDLLRAECRAGTEIGRRVAGFIDAGRLVPDDMIVQVVLSRILGDDSAAGFLLDGFPRTLPQARCLDEALANVGRRIGLVLSLGVPDEFLIERITGRRTCPACGRVYHTKFHRPAVEGVCDFDGELLVQRKDDTAEVVRQRLQAYHAQTEPLEQYYRDRDLLMEVDGTQEIDAVFENLKRAIDATSAV